MSMQLILVESGLSSGLQDPSVKNDVSVIAFTPQCERKTGKFTAPLPDAGDGLHQFLYLESGNGHDEDPTFRQPAEERYFCLTVVDGARITIEGMTPCMIYKIMSKADEL